MTDKADILAQIIWETSRLDEGTISATGAKKVADAILTFNLDTKSLNEYAEQIHLIAKEHGWWEKQRNFGEMVALMHSELSEALESHRKGERAVWFEHQPHCALSYSDSFPCACHPKPEGWATELVDCVIRILDTLYQASIDIDDLTRRKMKYNASRPYKHGGKEY